jgi:hypothetical protein
MPPVLAKLVGVGLLLAGGVTPGWLGHGLVADKRLWEIAMAKVQLELEMLDSMKSSFQTFKIPKETPEEHDEWLRSVLADKVNSRAAPATIVKVEPFGQFCRIEAETAAGPLVLSHGHCEPPRAPGDKVEIFGRIMVGEPRDPNLLNPAVIEKVGTIARLTAGKKKISRRVHGAGESRPAPAPR